MDVEYLQRTVGEVLARGLAQVVLKHPTDAVEFLGQWLLCEVDTISRREVEEKEKKQLAIEREESSKRSEHLRLKAHHEKLEQHARSIEQQRKKVEERSARWYLKLAKRAEAIEEPGLSPIDLVRRRVRDTLSDIGPYCKRHHAELRSQEPPRAMIQIIQGLLFLLGYQRAQVDNWDKCRAIINHEWLFARLESTDFYADPELPQRFARMQAVTQGLSSEILQSCSVALAMFYELLKGVTAIFNDQQSGGGARPRTSSAVAKKKAPRDDDDERSAADEDGSGGAAEEAAPVPVAKPSGPPGKTFTFAAPGPLLSVATSDAFAGGSVDPHRLSALPFLDTRVLDRDITDNRKLLLRMTYTPKANKPNPGLDISCIMTDSLGNVLDNVFENQLASRDGSVMHAEDEVPDSASLELQLNNVPLKVRILGVVLNFHSEAQTFTNVESVALQLTEVQDGGSMGVDFRCWGDVDRALMLAGIFYRDIDNEEQWIFKAIGETVPEDPEVEAQTFMDALPLMMQYLDCCQISEPAMQGFQESPTPALIKRGESTALRRAGAGIRIDVAFDTLPSVAGRVELHVLEFQNDSLLTSYHSTDAPSAEQLVTFSPPKPPAPRDPDIAAYSPETVTHLEAYEAEEPWTVEIELNKMSPENTSVFLVVSNFAAHDFPRVQHLSATVRNRRTGALLTRFTPPPGGVNRPDTTGAVLLRLFRDDDGVWRAGAVGQATVGDSHDLLAASVARIAAVAAY